MINFFRRLWVLVTEVGTVSHFGDGKDFILVKEIPPIITDYKKLGDNTCSYTANYSEAKTYGKYLERIGFKEIRRDQERIMRFKCETGEMNMMFTRQLTQPMSQANSGKGGFK